MQTDALAEQLFALANDHNQSRQERVAQMVPLLLALEAKKFKPDTRSWENSDCQWQSFKLQSLLDRKEELLFFGSFIQLIFKHYSELVQSFSWGQRQEYDDHFFPFNLQDIQLNDFSLTYVNLEARLDTFIEGSCELISPSEEYLYRHNAARLGLPWEGPLDEAFWAKVQALELYEVYSVDWGDADALEAFKKTYEPPGSVFLIFMQSLLQAYGVNYFIDLFGWSSSVYIDEAGITLELVDRTPTFPLEPEMPAYQQKTIQKTTSEKPWWKFW